jgi:dienelactone hydrolase
MDEIRVGDRTEVPKKTWLLVLLIITVAWLAAAIQPGTAMQTGEQGPCAISSRAVTVGSDLTTHLAYPRDVTCEAGITAPYPAVAFAHGFSMSGLSNGALDNLGNGEHLASWGYVVAIPELPDDFEARISAMQQVLSYLEAEATSEGSFLYRKVDTDRLAAAGHSLGGATALALASRDPLVQAVVALDPVYHAGGPGGGDAVWDPEAEGPGIKVPAGVLGAPGSSCNADADYARIYPWIGATHKASYTLVGGSHCDFNDPGNPLCGLICGSADPARTNLGQKYMTAWFNYYLYLDTGSYDDLYGALADADVENGLIQQQTDTAARGLAANGIVQAIRLDWTPYAHPIIAGYDLYRRLPGESYAGTPHARVGRIGMYTDTGVVVGQIYSYTVRSRDAAGNLHQAASEAATMADGDAPGATMYLPLITG